jgi:hypothetical protein
MQHCFASLRESNQHFTMIRIGCNPLDYSMLGQPVDQLNGAVVANQHSRRELSNRGFHAIRQAFYCQQELVLLRLDSVRARLIFTEAQEAAELVAEFGQVL